MPYNRITMSKFILNPVRFILPGLIILLMALQVKADWINLTGAQNAPNIAEIYVNNDHVKLILEISVSDIGSFKDLLPEELFRNRGLKVLPQAERLQHFASTTFQFVTEKGKKLPARLKLFEPRQRQDRPNPYAGAINPATGRPVPGPPPDKRVFYAELVYPFTTRPQTLTIIPPLDDKGNPQVSIGFLAYHQGVPVVDYRFLTGSSRLHLDWDDPWYSRFEKKSLKRWQESGLMTFIYIDPFEVRHETLVRVKDLAAWMDLGLKGGEFIEPDEIEPLKQRVGEFLLKHSKVRIDGKQLRPILDRTSFVKYTMTRTYFLETPERLPLNTAMLGVIITYLTDGLPQEVMLQWDLFSDRIKTVPASAVDPAGPLPLSVTPADNVLTWKNYLKDYKPPTVTELVVDDSLTKVRLPMGSLLCLTMLVPILLIIRTREKKGRPVRTYAAVALLLAVAAGLLYPYLNLRVGRPAVMAPKLTDKQAVAVLDSLLNNVYRAFDFREEDAVYDRLATSVSGDLLRDIYMQNRKSLVVTQAGGARARVKEVEIQDVKVKHHEARPLALLFHSKWTALGTVGHWGHIHIRKNQYEANITVEPVKGVWKITGLELLEEKRIDSYAQQEKS
jgi:hypothetical protein